MWTNKNDEMVVKFTNLQDIQELLKMRAGRLAGSIGHYPAHIDEALEHSEQS
jgi:hypothetical protein